MEQVGCVQKEASGLREGQRLQKEHPSILGLCPLHPLELSKVIGAGPGVVPKNQLRPEMRPELVIRVNWIWCFEVKSSDSPGRSSLEKVTFPGKVAF
jgi:hypothetical protein